MLRLVQVYVVGGVRDDDNLRGRAAGLHFRGLRRQVRVSGPDGPASVRTRELTRELTSSGWAAAVRSAVRPPRDWPVNVTGARDSSRMNATASRTHAARVMSCGRRVLAPWPRASYVTAQGGAVRAAPYALWHRPREPRPADRKHTLRG